MTLRLPLAMVAALSALPALPALLAGCPAADACTADDECTVDAVCQAGHCVAVTGEGEGEGAAGAGEGEGEGAAAGEGEGEGAAAGEGEGEGGGGGCTLTDGVLQETDLPVVPGLPIRYVEANSSLTSSPDLEVSVDGSDVAGVTTWDFTGALAGDAAFPLEAAFIAGKWYASTFDGEAQLGTDGVGAYVAPLSADTEAIFRRSHNDLVILGVASVEADRTIITYDPPILVLQFPLQDGDTFSSTSTGSGTFNFNAFYVSTDEYTTTLDGSGSVVTNAGTFPALRMRVDQSVTVGFFNVTHIQYAWLAACLGVVAQVVSGDGETDPHFAQAASVRRLAAP